ncbi:MAG: AAA family ATPase [Hyphomicrobiales bacterium]|nr:AAA family ATPase [Hyphomicrobiales bacterium]MCP5370869.1 AAA family ATPase [Hyphomicrobiales bacterium]
MIVEDQGKVIGFLSGPAAFGADPGAAVERVETHISLVFLCGARVLKLKRAVRFPFLDFSTADLRRAACDAEVAVNRRTAPGLYRGVHAITREADGTLALDGAGAPVDWVVAMHRFDQDTLFDRLAQRGALDRHMMEDLAETIAGFHLEAEVCAGFGGRAGIENVLDGNARTFDECAPGNLDESKVAALEAMSRAFLQVLGRRLDTRRDAGWVRHCHGDLHLRNVCLVDGRATLFDAIEFNPGFANIDVLYDLAFLLMDLDHRGRRRLANVVLNRYLDHLALHGRPGDGGLAAMPLFLAVRAAIRAHVGASTANSLDDPDAAAAARDEARAYLDLALTYLAPPPPRLVAVGGLSGSGKSRMAREIAPFVGGAPGARVLRSDVLRKRLAGVGPLTRLAPAHYGAEASRAVYDRLMDEAVAVAETGHSVIVDAVFARPEERAAAEAAAVRAGVPFAGLWLQAPPEVMVARVTARQNNASDADAGVVRRQLGYDLGDIAWPVVDSDAPRNRTLARGRKILGV